jgi:hypothetical protein
MVEDGGGHVTTLENRKVIEEVPENFLAGI